MANLATLHQRGKAGIPELISEDSSHYEAVDAVIDYSWLDGMWPDAKLVFDSAFHARGGRYRLKYLGSVSVHQKAGLPAVLNAELEYRRRSV